MENLDIIDAEIRDGLEPAVQRMLAHFGRPQWVNERFEYPMREAALVQLLKAIRVVSALNAVVAILKIGYTIEAATLLRTVDDFLGEISFLMEASEKQRKFVEHFFDENMDDLIDNPPGSSGITRGEIRQAQTREFVRLSELAGFTPSAEMVEKVRKRFRAISAGYNAYAHGSYHSIMEMYEGGRGFHMRGVPVRTDELRGVTAQFIVSALNTFALLGLNMGDEDLFHRLSERRRHFMETPAIIQPRRAGQ